MTSEYAGFRTFIAMLRILIPTQSQVTNAVFSQNGLTQTIFETTQTEELNSSYRRSA